MTVNIKYVVLISVICIVVGGVLGNKYAGVKTETKIQTQIQTIVKDHIVTVTKTVKEPNGATETDSTTTSDIVKTQDTQKSSDTVTVATNWHVSGGVGFQLNNSLTQSYNAQIERRIIGPIFIGVSGSTDHDTAGIVLGLEF